MGETFLRKNYGVKHSFVAVEIVEKNYGVQFEVASDLPEKSVLAFADDLAENSIFETSFFLVRILPWKTSTKMKKIFEIDELL